MRRRSPGKAPAFLFTWPCWYVGLFQYNGRFPQPDFSAQLGRRTKDGLAARVGSR